MSEDVYPLLLGCWRMNQAGLQGEGAQHRRRCWGYFIMVAVYSTSNGGDIDRSGCCIPFFRML